MATAAPGVLNRTVSRLAKGQARLVLGSLGCGQALLRLGTVPSCSSAEPRALLENGRFQEKCSLVGSPRPPLAPAQPRTEASWQKGGAAGGLQSPLDSLRKLSALSRLTPKAPTNVPETGREPRPIYWWAPGRGQVASSLGVCSVNRGPEPCWGRSVVLTRSVALWGSVQKDTPTFQASCLHGAQGQQKQLLGRRRRMVCMGLWERTPGDRPDGQPSPLASPHPRSALLWPHGSLS